MYLSLLIGIFPFNRIFPPFLSQSSFYGRRPTASPILSLSCLNCSPALPAPRKALLSMWEPDRALDG